MFSRRKLIQGGLVASILACIPVSFGKSKEVEHKNKYIVLNYNDFVGLKVSNAIFLTKSMEQLSYNEQRKKLIDVFNRLGWDDGVILTSNNSDRCFGYKSLEDLTQFFYRQKLYNWSISYSPY